MADLVRIRTAQYLCGLLFVTLSCATGVVSQPALPTSAESSVHETARALATNETDPSTDPASLTEQITARNRSLEHAFRGGDMPAVAAVYADDAVMLAPGGGRYVGRAAIDTYWANFTEPVDWKLEVLGVEGGDTLATQRGRSTLTYRREGGAQTSVVEFVLVWVRTGGQWRIAVDAYWN